MARRGLSTCGSTVFDSIFRDSTRGGRTVCRPRQRVESDLQAGRIHPHTGRHPWLDGAVRIRSGFDPQLVDRRLDVFGGDA